MKSFLPARKKKAILSTVLAGISVCGVTLPQTAEAMEEFDIGWDGKTLFNIQYYGASDKNEARDKFFVDRKHATLNYDLTSDVKSGLNKAFKWWAEILGPGANISQPAQYFVGTYNDQNAGATGLSIKNDELTHNPNFFKEIFQSGQAVPYFNDIADYTNNDAYYANKTLAMGKILIGQYLGFDALNDGGYGFVNSAYYANPTPQNILGTDISAVMFHEIGHSLGISAFTGSFSSTLNGTTYTINGFRDVDEKSFSAHLYDQYGTKATPNAIILPSKDDLPVLNAILDENPDMKAEIKPGNTLYVPNTLEARQDGKMYLYFAGKNVVEVLDGKTFTRGDGQQISGIPINLWEGGTPEISHLELARSMMSHQNYRSYVNFMEAELAALQDMGYNIDRRNFYGRSIYNDGLTLTNTQGFSARQNGKYVDGYNNSTFGTGLHIYGSNNNITQAGNIYANGAGAVGVRVDGVNNTITVPRGTEIHADGSNNNGILIAYGKNHNVNVEGTVTATGESGNALSFDFGANALGASKEIRGSFMRYARLYRNNSLAYAKNLAPAEFFSPNDMWSFTDQENGDMTAPMVNTVNISGKLIADPENSGNAIYIDSTAFVDTININDGAEIKGNIHSQWKHFSPEVGILDNETPIEEIDPNDKLPKLLEGLKLQYKGGEYLYTKYIPDLVTKLNFNNTMAYDGDIDGMDNMKINVNGNLVYGGAADVVSVNVAKDAGLFGGTFTVNDMTAKMAEGFSDDTTGKFYNHGTIGSAYSDKSMTINGNLVSDGTLSGYAGGDLGNIVVNGTANVEGSTISVTNALPDETMTVLKAGTVTGALANPDGKPYAATGMLSTTGTIEGNTVKVTAHSANNLGEVTAEQAEAYDAMNAMQKKLVGDARRNEMRSLYSLDSSAAKSALTELGSSAAPQMTSLVQQSTVADRVISDRLSTAFATKPVEVTLPVSHFADGEEEKGLNMNVELPVAQDNNAWVKFTKNWGDLRGGADYHGSAISGGYDRMLSENWRGGVFLSYQTMGLGARAGSGNIYDTRFGIYAGYHKDAADAYLYADYGWIRNKLRRGISALGLGAEARYNSNLVEIGGEYKYDLHARDGKIWHVSPYAGLQLSWLNQKSYAENGAGIFNQHVSGKHNTYFAGQLGVELKRYLPRGSYGMRLGVKHAFAGADPELSFCYEGNDSRFYSLRNSQDKTHFIFALSGDTEFANGWFLNGEARLQKGAHDKDLLASVTLRKVW
ncbi:autotransporter domain-containing protein [Selenomonas sp. AB3002]|uniref:autotransporter outer membrane beta-barrel domain-containing protein n=1 Tax=Selenomonas sp. AB3002 TaxID=1392502 RepID=UPI0004975B75